ncbi:hypothetical protein KZX06_09325 [Micrococcus sp. EYE_162]|uniref:TadE family type IV pilus minor pilin n=1 Tax=unclassified Micrococcus TaxID=2620948 RepID=UPI0020050C52|nr:MULTISPECIES: TadE family type IV pilus minor pilin [unclassified Micrococcus]MCK6096129.1 hypothetical protein [Micrococcus sp. EYE_212]MCK6172220.1 hypothetical protein [Micrococcus sp. EYE_162]
MPRPRTASAGERGAVTAEYAALLPAVVLILVAVVLAGAASVQQVRNGDAAASAARLLARGDDVGEARRTVERMAGEEARLAHEEGDGWVTVTVSHPGPGPLGWIEPIALEVGAAAPLQHPHPGEAS